MQPQQQQPAQNFFDPRRQPLRGEARALAEVETIGAIQLGDNFVPPGRHKILIWESQIPAFEELVERDRDGRRRAHAQYERGLVKMVAKTSKLAEGKTMDQLRELAESTPELAAAIKRAELTTGDSPQAQYQALNDRAPSALVDFKVLERGLPEPGLAIRHEQQNAQATAMGKALAETLAPVFAQMRQDAQATQTALAQVSAQQSADNKTKK